MADDPEIQRGLSEEENLEADAEVAESIGATAEAYIDFRKFLRLLRFRLVRQGLRITWLWLVNYFRLQLTGTPERKTSEVLPHLYVGGQYGKLGWPVISDWGVTAVVNMRVEFDDAQAGLSPPAYLYLPTVDDAAPSLEDLWAGVTFIQNEIAAGGRVYIHCAAGVGRAPTMAAAYLISTGLSIDEAWGTIRKHRPFIRPTRAQIQQIERFTAETLAAKRSGPLNKA